MKVVFDRKFHQMNYQRSLLFFSNDHLLSKSIDFNNEKGYSQYGPRVGNVTEFRSVLVLVFSAFKKICSVLVPIFSVRH